MRTLLLLFTGLIFSMTTPAHAVDSLGTNYFGPGPHAVETLRLSWQDTARHREVPAKIFYPKDLTTPCPVIIFSHGLGGSRDGYPYLGRFWAGHGYISVHLQHLGSDSTLWEDKTNVMPKMKAAIANLDNSRNRPLDVTFALDELTRMNKETNALRGRLDLNRVGVSGHSYGGFTTLAIAGEKFGPPRLARDYTDPRVKAGIPMSAPVPMTRHDYADVFSAIKMPLLHMTGTKDDSPVGETRADQRRIPYDHVTAPHQYFLNLQDADHMVFAQRRDEADAAQHRWICASSVAFWDAYLRQDTNALAWLNDFGKTLGTNGVFEKKP